MSIPLQIGMPFAPGKAFSPVFAGVPTQTAIKCRWPDGSVKHAVLSAVAPEGKLEIFEGQSVTFGIFAIDAVIELAGVQVKLSDLPVAESPLPNSRVYADDSGAHDLASNEGTKGRPRFHVTYYPDGNAFVRFFIENSNTEAAGQLLAPRRCLLNGVEVFSNLALTWQQQMIPVGGRFVFETWLKPTPQPNVKFDLGYLTATKALPNFDTSITVDPAALTSMYQTWQSSNKDVALAKSKNWGLFPSAMDTSGARADWGCYPAWSVMSIYSGDARLAEVDRGNANLAAMYGLHFRECDPIRASYKRPIRIWDRPYLQLSHPTDGGDGLKRAPNTDFDNQGLIPGPAHVPNPYFILWLTTGDYFYLEQMKFFVSYCIAYSNGGFRGPTGREGGIPGADAEIFQTRGQGLGFRLMVELAAFCPDDDPDKAYYQQIVDDCITIWEGERNVNPRADARWQFGRTRQPQDSPLHKWSKGNDGMTQTPVDWTKCACASSQWEESVVAYGLLRGRELGFKTQSLLDFMTAYWLSLGKWLSNYRIASQDSNRKYFQTLDEVKAVTNLDGDGNPGYDVNAQWENNRNLDQGFTTVAGQPVIATGDPAYWAWFKKEVYDKLPLKDNPKWAHLPR